MNMKVCIVVFNSVWLDPRVRKQILEYKKHGFEVHCVGVKCPRYDEREIALVPCQTDVICVNEKYEGKQKHIWGKFMRDFSRYATIYKVITKSRPDIIHANDLDALRPAYYIAKKLKCKLVYDTHEICIENRPGRKALQFIRELEKKHEKHMINHLEQMVCVSHATADYFVENYGIKKTMVVTNCALRSDIVTSETTPHDGFEILNHGQFYAGRGYDIMVEAAAQLQGHPEIKMALRGYGCMEQQLKSRVEELKLSNVVFYPKVKVEELIPEAAKSMVGLAITEPICLNFKLSVSNKLFEYVAAGLPVIMSDIPEHRYLNDKYQFGIIIPDNSPEELAKAALKLYQDKELYATCRANALLMREEVNWENEFAKLIEAEKRMMEETR